MEDILTFTINPEYDENGNKTSQGTRWLSNFAPCKVYLDDDEEIITSRKNKALAKKPYANVEQAYQAAKNRSEQWRTYCKQSKYPQTCKKLAHPDVLKLRSDWSDETKVKIMRKLLEQKFNQEPYKKMLLETGICHLEEGNYWGDTFWGTNIETRDGMNMLGQLIMSIRADLLAEQNQDDNITNTPTNLD